MPCQQNWKKNLEGQAMINILNNMKQNAIKTCYDKIINYYDSCEMDYKIVWRLNRCLAMHLGYWDETTNGVSDALIRENEIMAIRAKINKDHYILDAGCGVGGSSIYLAKNIGCRAVGISLSESQIRACKKNSKKHRVSELTDFKVMDFCNTEFENEIFDVVWAIESVCHAPDKNNFIKEAFRILKPGGKLVIADGWASLYDYNAEDRKLMKEWTSGFCVNELAHSSTFRIFLKATGFIELFWEDTSNNIRPSVKRLYQYARRLMLPAKILNLLGIRSDTQHGNLIAAHQLYITLEKKLWHYGIICVQKPEKY